MKNTSAVMLVGSLIFATTTNAADIAPTAPEASPVVYRTLTETDQWRVVEATWQPGQEDEFHSHPADRVSLYKTNCKLRLTNADGSSRIAEPKAGTAKARTGKPVPAHKAKNLGNEVCIIQIVELK
jgi:hypothetical protein